MYDAASPDALLSRVRDTIVATVRQEDRDLTARQLGIFLICYLENGPHTVRGLAATLNVARSVVSRALDRLGELDLARRRTDPADRRSVLVCRTLTGTAFLEDLRAAMTESAERQEVLAAWERAPDLAMAEMEPA